MAKVLGEQEFVQAVEDMVEMMFITNDSVTTLDVKMALRAQGIYAVQTDVANAMYQIWQRNMWEYTFNGTYRTYYPSVRVALLTVTLEELLTSVTEISPRLADAITVKYVYPSRNVYNLEVVSNPQVGDYLVYASQSDPVVFVRGAIREIDARNFYCTQFGVSINFVVAALFKK